MSKRVAVLTDRALIAAERRDEAKVEDARKRAEAHLREKRSETEVAHVNASLTRCVAQLQAKRRQQRSGPLLEAMRLPRKRHFEIASKTNRTKVDPNAWFIVQERHSGAF